MNHPVDTAQHRPPGEDTRVRILRAAREIFAVNGSRGTTTREIAERAGVNEATVFRHFGTKQHLLEAMREHYVDAASLREVYENLSGSLEQQFRTIALAMLAKMHQNEDLIRISLAEEFSDPFGCSATWKAPVESMRLLEQFMAERIESGELQGDALRLASLFSTLLFGFVMAHRRIWQFSRMDDQGYVDFVIPIFLRGVLA
jgi:AcrR family transcriptional regulator